MPRHPHRADPRPFLLPLLVATAASGSGDGFLWMMVIGRGVAGLGAGGEYSVCTAAAIEVSEDNA